MRRPARDRHSARTYQHPLIDERLHHLLDEEGVAARALTDERPEPAERRVGAEQRTEGLRRNDRPDHVDVHLAAEVVGGQFQHRTRHSDTGIIDEPCQRFAIQRRTDLAGGGQHRGLIGDVEQQRRKIGAELAFEAVGIGLFADAAEDTKCLVQQQFRGSPADAPVPRSS